MKRKLLAAFLGAALLAGLLTGCRDLLHPEGPRDRVVTFSVENSAWKKVSVKKDDPIGSAMPSNPSREGYTFAGWYTERNGAGKQFIDSTQVNEDMTVYANWTVAQRIVTFDLQGGNINGSSVQQTRTLSNGSALGVNMPSSPSRDNYTFGGWYTAINGGGNAFNDSTPVTASMTIYAKWTAIQRNVTFDLQGGNINGSVTSLTRTVNSGASLGANTPSNPSRDNYIFGGWYTAINGGGVPFNDSTPVTADLIIYAKWMILPQYTVTFDLQGGNIYGDTAQQTRTVYSGFSLGVNMPFSPSRDNYTFNGWFTSSGGYSASFIESTPVGADITVYADWVVIQRNVTFDLQGGNMSGSTAQVTRTVNSGASLGANTPSNPSRDNYTFDGWFTATNGGGNAVTSSTPITVNLTVYAKWTIIQRLVTFDLQGGNMSGSTAQVTRTVNSGTALGANTPSNPSRDEYIFDGWYISASGSNTFTSSTMVTADMTVYAKWTIIQYTVTFDLQGGKISGDTAAQTRTVNSGASLGANIPSNPSRNGYTFDGWFTSTGGSSEFTDSTPISANLTIYAKWTIAQMPSNLSLAETLAWISSNAIEGGNYTITLKNDETIASQSLSYDVSNVSITLDGGTAERIVILNSNGVLFTIGDGVSLTLGNNVTLQGRSSNTASLVRVNSGGTLTMNTGSKITGNTNAAATYSSSSNNAYSIPGGGGVYVNGGTFTMNGGEISGNSASRTSSSYSSSYSFGGGVYISGNGMFTMSGGTISGNISSYSSSSNNYSYGGGVCVYYGTFTMSGGTISGNTSSSYNYSYGGGVFVYISGIFTMTGGTISGNSAAYFYGGGVYVNGGTFIKQSGGIIYGSNASSTLKNTVSGNDYGHAVYVSSTKIRNSTAGSGVTLNSGVSGSAGGWE
ncbi:MAG: InlB B-repeat-containing protein [Treponema sp.]|jgi:uncharacterized repeat protein (TIGR02543 family)|nr:InlB B-repeat-containing protein [Treponema sp.]